jgi:hypothetical protein
MSKRTVRSAFVFPLCWLALTLVRGALIHWHPYPFIEVDSHCFARVAVNVVAVAAAFFVPAAGAMWLDRSLTRGATRQPRRV